MASSSTLLLACLLQRLRPTLFFSPRRGNAGRAALVDHRKHPQSHLVFKPAGLLHFHAAADIRSTLQPEPIHFRDYDATEILQILDDRARTGLNTVPEGLLAQIAAMTVSGTNSDVRVAIKTLYYAALEDPTDLQEVFHRARHDLVADVLASLNDRNLLILKATAEVQEPFVKAIYAQYRRLSLQHHLEPFSYVHFYSSLSYLQSIGLIVLSSTKVGRAYTNRVQLLFQIELLDRVHAQRLG